MKIIRRDDTDFEICFRDKDGNPVDITGGTVFFTVKKNLFDTDNEAVIKKEITVFQDPTDGIAILQLTKNDTDIVARDYFYDIQLVLNDKVTSSDRGEFVVRQDVTVRNSV